MAHWSGFVKQWRIETAAGEISSLPFSGILHEEPSFSVTGVLLDHKIPCLGLSVTEKFYVNIVKERLKELELPVGPWLNRFKAAIYEGRDPESEEEVPLDRSTGRNPRRPRGSGAFPAFSLFSPVQRARTRAGARGAGGI